jgi:hypothetical protein
VYTIIAIGLAGSLGGFISTLLPTGTDVPLPGVLQTPLNEAHWIVCFIVHAVINLVVGAFMAIVLWAAVDPTATSVTSMTIQPKQLATAAGIGLAGIAVAKKLQQQSVDATDWKSAFQHVTAAASQLKTKQPL